MAHWGPQLAQEFGKPWIFRRVANICPVKFEGISSRTSRKAPSASSSNHDLSELSLGFSFANRAFHLMIHTLIDYSSIFSHSNHSTSTSTGSRSLPLSRPNLSAPHEKPLYWLAQGCWSWGNIPLVYVCGFRLLTRKFLTLGNFNTPKISVVFLKKNLPMILSPRPPQQLVRKKKRRSPRLTASGLQDLGCGTLRRGAASMTCFFSRS